MKMKRLEDLQNASKEVFLPPRARRPSCPTKGLHENCSACSVAKRPRYKKVSKEREKENKYGSVSSEVESAMTQSQKMRENLLNISISLQKNKKLSEIADKHFTVESRKAINQHSEVEEISNIKKLSQISDHLVSVESVEAINQHSEVEDISNTVTLDGHPQVVSHNLEKRSEISDQPVSVESIKDINQHSDVEEVSNIPTLDIHPQVVSQNLIWQKSLITGQLVTVEAVTAERVKAINQHSKVEEISKIGTLDVHPQVVPQNLVLISDDSSDGEQECPVSSAIIDRIDITLINKNIDEKLSNKAKDKVQRDSVAIQVSDSEEDLIFVRTRNHEMKKNDDLLDINQKRPETELKLGILNILEKEITPDDTQKIVNISPSHMEVEDDKENGDNVNQDIQPKPNSSIAVEKIEDKDKVDLSQIWRQMNLAYEYSKDSGPLVPMENSMQENQCNHLFIYQDDLGQVCRLCGLIGERAESMFEFEWKKGRKRHKFTTHEHSENFSAKRVKVMEKERERNVPVFKLVLHPMLEQRMHTHQRNGFKFLTRNLISEEPGGCIVAHAPGTGKTFLVTSFIQSFLQKYCEERILIVAPKPVLCSWKKELSDWQVEDVPLLNLYDVYNRIETTRFNQLEILKRWKETKSILLVSYAQFSSIVSDKSENEMSAGYQSRRILLKCPGLLVLDEGHFPRNSKTNILTALMQVQTRRRILLSGTLFQNNITELFNLLRLARPDILEESSFQTILNRITSSEKYSKLTNRRPSFDKHDRIFCDELESSLQSGSQEIRATAIYDLQELVSPFVHYYKGEILEGLPGLTDFVVILTVNDSQKEAIESIKALALPRMSKLIKESAVCIHPALQRINLEKGDGSPECVDSDIAAEMVIDPEAGVKTKFLLDLLMLCEHNDEKLLVFSQFLSPLALLENLIIDKMKWRKGTEIMRLDGNTLSDTREEVIQKFNNSKEAKILFASIKACGEGINLTGASRVVLLDIQWNPSITRQAISRAFRIGQRKKVFAYRLVAADTFEEDIFKAAFSKEVISKLIFDGHDHCDNQDSLMSEVAESDCEDSFFESKALKKNVKTLYKLKVI